MISLAVRKMLEQCVLHGTKAWQSKLTKLLNFNAVIGKLFLDACGALHTFVYLGHCSFDFDSVSSKMFQVS